MSLHDETKVNHQPQVQMKPGNRPLVPPIYQSVKYTFDKFSDMQAAFSGTSTDFVYSRMANPTTRQLEQVLSQMQGTEDGLVLSTGVAAVSSLLLAILKSGDHVILFLESYRPTRIFITKILKRYGVESTLVSVEDKAGLEKAFIKGKTKAIIFESPTNPVLKIADIELICALAKKHGVLTIMDNTFAGLKNHHDYPIDFYIHSLTKFAVGHGDAMGGAILGAKALIQPIRSEAATLGAALSPDAAALIQRGIKTYYLRMERQCANAGKLAEWLSKDKRITNLKYPGLTSHPQHLLAKKQMGDFGALIAFDLVGKAEVLNKFIDRLKVFVLAASLGSVESLAAPCELFFTSDLSESEKKAANIGPTTVRLSVGIEHIDDLIADLDQALGK